MAVPVIRANSPGAQVGIVNVHFPNRPASDTDADIAAAARAELLDLRWFLDPLFGRGYPAEALAWYGANEPQISAGEMETIAAPLDFLGVNYYYRRIIASDPDESLFGYQELPHHSSAATGTFWSEINPRALGDHLLWLAAQYPGPQLYITENGLPLPDESADERGFVDDQARIDYLADHIQEIGRAISGGAPVAGYFAWCLFDTFEWNYGYIPRFGLVRIERPTLERVPKASAHWYRALIGS
jgi:beta-glucosidase